ncbi:hypothetical protein N7509_013163 [Penicillium cosmopolitanum]|uniref:Uncharacterized protein n=1 Tax=Penicillium cosmopolitanum TaxID=1131564 RepID=A0A9W9SDR8_9EURO|nr:uncharacterized protein N7509_013163 [Penicillium cosmopolitanum]KAJ5376277.1 hypothetical protein N7509_013163 [Penicillium cosmopolitanum]
MQKSKTTKTKLPAVLKQAAPMIGFTGVSSSRDPEEFELAKTEGTPEARNIPTAGIAANI